MELYQVAEGIATKSLRIEIPNNVECPSEIAALVHKCSEFDPSLRPTFTDIVKLLSLYLLRQNETLQIEYSNIP